MTPDKKALKVRKVMEPAIEEYWATRTKKDPHGCKTRLAKVVSIYEECQKGLNGSMPTANKIGYADKRDDLNNAMEHHGLRHSYGK